MVEETDRQRAALATLLNSLLAKVLDGRASADDLACANEPERWNAKAWAAAARYCGCLRCDTAFVERLLYRIWGRDYADALGEPERGRPRTIHTGTMAVVDYVAASRGEPRPFRARGRQAHIAACPKCQRQDHRPSPRAAVTSFLARERC